MIFISRASLLKVLFFAGGLWCIAVYNVRYLELQTVEEKRFSEWVKNLIKEKTAGEERSPTNDTLSDRLKIVVYTKPEIKQLELTEDDTPDQVLRLIEVVEEARVFRLSSINENLNAVDQHTLQVQNVTPSEFPFLTFKISGRGEQFAKTVERAKLLDNPKGQVLLQLCDIFARKEIAN
jgi:hypothetical protein